MGAGTLDPGRCFGFLDVDEGFVFFLRLSSSGFGGLFWLFVILFLGIKISILILYSNPRYMR